MFLWGSDHEFGSGCFFVGSVSLTLSHFCRFSYCIECYSFFHHYANWSNSRTHNCLLLFQKDCATFDLFYLHSTFYNDSWSIRHSSAWDDWIDIAVWKKINSSVLQYFRLSESLYLSMIESIEIWSINKFIRLNWRRIYQIIKTYDCFTLKLILLTV